MKFFDLGALILLQGSAFAYFDTNWYTGVACTGNELWEFRVDANNSHECHDVQAVHAGSFLVSSHNGETDNTYLVFYDEPGCKGNLVIRAQDECLRFHDVDVRSFRYGVFNQG